MADKSWKAQAMRSLGDEQRRMLLADLARRIVALRMQQATNRLSATSELLAARRALARLKTILHEKVVHDGQAAAKAASDTARKARVDGLKAATQARRQLIEQNEKARQAATERKAKGKPKAEKSKGKAGSAKK